MCGCTSGGGYSTSSTSYCGGQVSILQDSRNKLAILYNHVQDPELKAKYKEDKATVDQIMYDAANGISCPDAEEVTTIVNYVNNEYAKYYNT